MAIAVGAALVVLIVILAVDIARVDSEVQGAKRQLELLDLGVRSGTSLADQQGRLDAFGADIASARRHTHGPLWDAVGGIPVLGRPLDTARRLTDVVQVLSTGTLPRLVAATNRLEPLRAGAAGGSIPLAPIAAAEPDLVSAEAGLAAAQTQATAVPGSWLWSVSHARNQLISQLTTLHRDMTVAATAARLAPQLLGADGDRQYLVVFLNPAEIRGGGGVIGGYAVLTAADGKIGLTKIGGEQDLPALASDPPGLDPEWLADYDVFSAAQVWQNTNISPDFPSSAAAWTAMYDADFHTHLDGVVSVDANALATLLQFSGPAQVDGQRVTSANAVDFLEQGEYQLPLSTAERKDVLGQVGQQVFHTLLGGQVSVQALLTALAGDADSGHLHVYAARPDEQALLAPYPVAGLLSRTTQPFFEATITDGGAEKLSEFVTERVTYAVGSCRADPRPVTVTVTLTNNAPTTLLPPYVSTRGDHPQYPVGRNQLRMYVEAFLTDGAKFGSATLDGQPLALLPAGDETTGDASGLQQSITLGHPTLSVFLELPAKKTVTLVLKIGEPASKAAPELPTQALPQVPTVTYKRGPGCASG